MLRGEKDEMSQARAGGSAEFAERMLRTMNEAALALMVSVGHRTGLFDVMAAVPDRQAQAGHRRRRRRARVRPRRQLDGRDLPAFAVHRL